MPEDELHADVNWFGVLAHHATRTPDRALAIFEGCETTFAQMASDSMALAGGLHERGVGFGDVVGLLSYTCPEFLETIFAANYLGAIAMPVNWRLAAPEIRYILEHSRARALVCDVSLLNLANEATAGLEGTLIRSCTSAADDGWTTLTDLRRGTDPPLRAATNRDDVHRLMYTSGTTGRPKGVMITHANLAWKNLAHIVEFGFTSSDLGLACGPLYHVGALDLTTTSLLAAGATSIIHRMFDAAAVVGRTDERWGEVPVAYVVLRPGHEATRDELTAHCARQLARFKVPKDVTFLDALPRNPSGKVLKRDLRQTSPR